MKVYAIVRRACPGNRKWVAKLMKEDRKKASKK